MQKQSYLYRLAIVLGLGAASLGNLAIAQEEAVAEAVVQEVAASEDAAKKPQLRPLTVTAGLVDDSKLTGTLIDSSSIQIKTAFGEAAIPLSEVAGIRFPAADDNSTTVVMLNGDSITGATDLKYVSIETVWGSAKINGQNVATMLFVPGLVWKSDDSIGGKRWNLTEATPEPAQPQQPVQQAGGTRQFQQNGRVIFGQ